MDLSLVKAQLHPRYIVYAIGMSDELHEYDEGKLNRFSSGSVSGVFDSAPSPVVDNSSPSPLVFESPRVPNSLEITIVLPNMVRVKQTFSETNTLRDVYSFISTK